MASGRLDGTELAVITLIPLAAFELVVGLPVATQALERVRRAADRVFEVTDAPIPVPEPDPAAEVPDGPYDLRVSSVWASYPGAVSPALQGVDLSLPPGRRVAVVGPSGAGKSTLAAVLLRFLPVESGSATLNGLSLDRLAGDAVRTVVGLVGQDVHLFDDTIAGNLRIGNRDATDDELPPGPRASGAHRLARHPSPRPCHRGGRSRRATLRWPTPTDRPRSGSPG